MRKIYFHRVGGSGFGMKTLYNRLFLLTLVTSIFILMPVQEAYCVSGSATYEAVITASTSGVVTGSTTTYDIQIVAGQPIIGPVVLVALL